MKIKLLGAVALTAIALTSAASAGERMVRASNESKDYVAPSAPECYRDQEWQVDVFGAYAFTDSNQSRQIGDHAWGGGLGLNYFFTRHVGIGIEGTWLDLRGGRKDAGVLGANLFLRLPCNHSCFAGYIYGGPDAVLTSRHREADHGVSDRVGGGHAGLGFEYRFSPKMGLFLDGRYTLLQNSHNDFATIRSGVRFAF